MTLPRALFVSLRPHQWTKNLFVLAALAFSKHLFEADAVLRAGLAFLVFCALSGAVYLVNDLADLEQDRLHPRKRWSHQRQHQARSIMNTHRYYSIARIHHQFPRKLKRHHKSVLTDLAG